MRVTSRKCISGRGRLFSFYIPVPWKGLVAIAVLLDHEATLEMQALAVEKPPGFLTSWGHQTSPGLPVHRYQRCRPYRDFHQGWVLRYSQTNPMRTKVQLCPDTLEPGRGTFLLGKEAGDVEWTGCPHQGDFITPAGKKPHPQGLASRTDHSQRAR